MTTRQSPRSLMATFLLVHLGPRNDHTCLLLCVPSSLSLLFAGPALYSRPLFPVSAWHGRLSVVSHCHVDCPMTALVLPLQMDINERRRLSQSDDVASEVHVCQVRQRLCSCFRRGYTLCLMPKPHLLSLVVLLLLPFPCAFVLVCETCIRPVFRVARMCNSRGMTQRFHLPRGSLRGCAARAGRPLSRRPVRAAL